MYVDKQFLMWCIDNAPDATLKEAENLLRGYVGDAYNGEENTIYNNICNEIVSQGYECYTSVSRNSILLRAYTEDGAISKFLQSEKFQRDDCQVLTFQKLPFVIDSHSSYGYFTHVSTKDGDLYVFELNVGSPMLEVATFVMRILMSYNLATDDSVEQGTNLARGAVIYTLLKETDFWKKTDLSDDIDRWQIWVMTVQLACWDKVMSNTFDKEIKRIKNDGVRLPITCCTSFLLSLKIYLNE